MCAAIDLEAAILAALESLTVPRRYHVPLNSKLVLELLNVGSLIPPGVFHTLLE